MLQNLLYFQNLQCAHYLISTPLNLFRPGVLCLFFDCNLRPHWYNLWGISMTDVISADCTWLVLLLPVPAAIELRFMPDPPTLSAAGTHRLNKSDNLELTCRCVLAEFPPSHPYTCSVISTCLSLCRQRPSVSDVVDSSHKHPLLHQWLQRSGALLHHAEDLQRDCQWDRTVPVLLQGPESGGWQDLSFSLCVRPRYNSL